jgi:hypothetical protein
MKHIKKFNESLINITDELQEFCNVNLAYLIDEGFNVKCTSQRTFKESGYYSRVGIYKPYNTFNWYDVRDDIIPFMKILKKEYNVDNYVKFYMNRDAMVKLDDIINDRIENFEITGGITFNVRNK